MNNFIWKSDIFQPLSVGILHITTLNSNNIRWKRNIRIPLRSCSKMWLWGKLKMFSGDKVRIIFLYQTWVSKKKSTLIWTEEILVELQSAGQFQSDAPDGLLLRTIWEVILGGCLEKFRYSEKYLAGYWMNHLFSIVLCRLTLTNQINTQLDI